MKSLPDQIDLPDDPRLMQAVEQYLELLEAGRRPQREEFLRQYADLAGPLNQCLDGLELVHRATAKEKAADQAAQEVAHQVAQEVAQAAQSSAGGRGAKQAPVGETSPASPLGDFQLLREIGRGGMGIVYEAVQLSLGRRVAVKVLPFAAALDAKQLQRFKNEAQAAGHLIHPNIVPVHAISCERGVHFYAMQLIEGQSLAALIAELRRSTRALGPDGTQVDPPSFAAVKDSSATGSYKDEGGRMRDELPSSSFLLPPSSLAATQAVAAISTEKVTRSASFFRRVAQLGIAAAEALEHAHQVGVVHRDIKPGNLLLDVLGNLWITDFGLATVQSDAGLTLSGELLGTLRYMSPEQALGKRGLIDHRTDVYALGATLYELLTLEPVLAGHDRQELLQQIAHAEPRPPRKIDPAIPVELETIVLKALSKNAAERYATAQAMADDLRRFLEQRPILARRPTVSDHIRKWMRRHPSVVWAAVLVLALGVIAFAVGYQRERRHAREAEDRFQLARRSVDEMIQLAEEELAEHPHLHNLRKRLLESALSYYQEFIEQRKDDPKAQEELSATRDRVKRILGDLAVLQGAWHFRLLGEAAVLEDLKPNDEQRQQIVELSRKLADQRSDRFNDFHRLTPEQRQQRFLQQARENEKAAASVLQPGQIARLRQISVQLQGPMAFRESDIAGLLKLTPEQREKIRGINADVLFLRIEAPGPGKPVLPSRVMFEDKRRTALEEIHKLLTPEQRKQWEELVGPPFKGGMSFFPPPGGREGPFNKQIIIQQIEDKR